MVRVSGAQSTLNHNAIEIVTVLVLITLTSSITYDMISRTVPGSIHSGELLFLQVFVFSCFSFSTLSQDPVFNVSMPQF